MLQIFVITALVFAGWFVASTFSTIVLITLTVLNTCFYVYVGIDIKGRGLDGIPHMIILISTPFFFVSAWTTWYHVNNLGFVGQFLHSYILR